MASTWYDDQDLVICAPEGGPQHPQRLSYYFLKETKRLGLPVIRLHDYADLFVMPTSSRMPLCGMGSGSMRSA